MKLPLKAYWKLLEAHVKPQMPRFILLGALLIGSVCLRIFTPQIMRSFIDSALAGQPLAILVAAAGAFIGVAFVQQAVSIASNYIGEKVAWTATNALRGEMAAHALSLDMSYHNDTTPGQLIERIDGDITEMSNFFSFFAMMLVTNGLMLVGIIAALFLEDWRAGLCFTAFVIAAAALMGKFRNIALPFMKARKEVQTELYGFLEEHLSGTEDIRSCGAVDYSVRKLIGHSSKILEFGKKAALRVQALNLISDASLTLGLVMTLIVGYKLNIAGIITAGTVYLFVHYLELLEEPIWSLTRLMESFQTIGACVERLTEFRALKPAISGGENQISSRGSRPSERAIEVELDGVNFSYNGSDAVLSDVSIVLKPGRVLGLLGRTGSGKTTLGRLVARLYDPSSGVIRFNGTDSRQARLSDIRSRVALVTQDVQLFQASIRENITFFDKGISDERIIDAIGHLELGDWLAKQPEGLDTMLESGGRSLSAGEAQLLAFTRVFLRDPGLVILDEASSRLDPATEARLERAVDRLLENRSAIVIAHRLGTVLRAHDIMILEDGSVAEYGPRAELTAEPDSRFRSLLAAGMEEALA